MDFLIWKYWDKNALSNKKKIIIFYKQSREKSLFIKSTKNWNAKFAKEWQKT